jgi:hypothetical protein
MTFPLPNPKPLGWGLFEAPTSAQMTQINANAARAADGTYWSDVTLANIVASSSISNGGFILGWDPASRFFYSFGGSGTTPNGSRSATGRFWSSLTIPTSLTLSIGNNRHAFAFDGQGTIIFGGSATSGISSYRRSTNGTSWTAISTSGTSNVNVRCIRWVPWLNAGAGFFVSGFANGAIETSPTGVAWTNRSVPDAQDRTSGIADNGSIVVMGNAGSPHFVTSPDGINWTQRTGASTVFSVVWSPYWAKFFAYGSTTVQSSADGITWSASGLTFPSAQITNFQTSTIPFGEFGRVLYIYGTNGSNPVLAYSVDGAATWRAFDDVSTVPTASTMVTAPHGQLIMTDGSSNHFATIFGGV